jgi:hypothetical protein
MIDREQIIDEGVKQIAREALRQIIMRSLQIAAGEDKTLELFDASTDYVLSRTSLPKNEPFDPAEDINILNKIDIWANDKRSGNIESRKKQAEIIKTCLMMASYILTNNHGLVYKNAVKLDSLVSYTR